MDLVPLMPRQAVPALRVPLAGGGLLFDLAAERPRIATLISFYRGLHCQQCSDYVADLHARLPDLQSRGIEAVAISCDLAERGERTPTDWGLKALRIGYGLTFQEARHWGLFLTEGRPRKEGWSEPPVYCEPGLFLVRPDGTLFFTAVQNMPFARPRIEDVVAGFDFMFDRGYFIDKDCPARGELLDVP
jgi:peroxiredoxin